MLLAEDLTVDHDLARWFLAEAGTWRQRPTLPIGEIEEVQARVNYWDNGPDIPVDAQGETDIELTLRWADGSKQPVLIEDKLWALFQDRQPECVVTVRACMTADNEEALGTASPHKVRRGGH